MTQSTCPRRPADRDGSMHWATRWAPTPRRKPTGTSPTTTTTPIKTAADYGLPEWDEDEEEDDDVEAVVDPLGDEDATSSLVALVNRGDRTKKSVDLTLGESEARNPLHSLQATALHRPCRRPTNRRSNPSLQQRSRDRPSLPSSPIGNCPTIITRHRSKPLLTNRRAPPNRVKKGSTITSPQRAKWRRLRKTPRIAAARRSTRRSAAPTTSALRHSTAARNSTPCWPTMG